MESIETSRLVKRILNWFDYDPVGSFATEEEAAQTYREAALKYHGEFVCLD